MEQRNTLCSYQMRDLQSAQGLNYHHPSHYMFPGNVVDHAHLNTNQHIQPLLSTGNVADLSLQFKDYHRGMFYGNHSNSSQNFHSTQNLGPNFNNSYMVPSSSSRSFPIPWNNGYTSCFPSSIHQGDVGIDTNEFGRNNEFVHTIGSGKRVNSEEAPGRHFNINGMESSSAQSFTFQLNSGLPQWGQSYELRPNLVDATDIALPVFQDRRTTQMTQGSHTCARSRSSATGLQPRPAFSPHHNYVLQGTHMGQSLHADSNMWLSQFGIQNNISDGVPSNWNYTDPTTYLQGRCVSLRAFETINMGMPAYDSAFNPPSLPDFDKQLPPIHTMQVQSYGYRGQIQMHSYQNTPTYLAPVNMNPSRDASDSGSMLVHFPFDNEQIHTPWHVHGAAPVSQESLRLLSAQDVVISDPFGVANVFDHYQDMRLDIDEMAYEELLALEEQIGDVKTGLTEEYMKENLKTTVRNQQIECLLSAEESPENECCVICQVEYEQDEIVGIVDCGHHYHEECIKRWLLLKNLCPICKTTALAAPKSER